ncbi:MAG: phosphoribosylamine--glycine ligase [Patescibacteria group bacterium]
MGAKVLVIGGGGREHALSWKLAQSPLVNKIYVAPGNGGTEAIAQNVPLGFTDAESLLKFAQDNQIDLTVIGQEAASAAGVVDAFQAAGLAIFGPTQAATQIESSKVFSKQLMRDQQIPTAEFQSFTDATLALKYLESRDLPIVIKASGLAEGKGVVVAETLAQAKTAIDDMMVKKVFKDAGNSIVIEDFLKGQEVSTHALCDGNTAVLFPASQDHKQVFDGGKGPNTGGMGVVAPLPWITTEHKRFVETNVILPTLEGLKNKNAPFTGCLYPGLMIDGEDIKVLEFNARFGDPEAETYLRLLESDLYLILQSCVQGKLDPSKVSWKSGAAISVAVASSGYPGSYQKGLPITGIDQAEKVDGVVVLQAGTIMQGSQLLTNGGRVLYVTALGTDINDARAKAYAAIKLIHFEGMHYRTDIGLAAEMSVK